MSLLLLLHAAVIISTVYGMEASQDHVRTVLLVLSHMAATQPHLKSLPIPALKVRVCARVMKGGGLCLNKQPSLH